MVYLLLVIVVAGLTFAIWRLTRAEAGRPTRTVIGPDDDPDFLRRIGRPDGDPSSPN